MRFKEYLDEYGIRVTRFAQRSGIAQQTLYRFLRGGSDMHLSTAMAIEKTTEGKVTCYDLYKDVNPQGRGQKKRKNIAGKQT